MTVSELKEYYADLLILQYVNRTKARATIEAIVEPVIMDQLPVQVQNAFDLEDAEGDQLDVIATYVGVSRNGYTFTGPVMLDDEDLRTLIRMAIVKNSAGSSLYDIQSLLDIYFHNTLLVFDYKNMHMSYFFDSSIGSENLAEMFVKQGLLPKPMGVQLAALIYSANIDNFFGFITYIFIDGEFGFNSYTDYDTNAPWLSYADAIVE